MKRLERWFRGYAVGRKFGSELAPHRAKLLLVGLGSFGMTGLALLKPWPLKWIFDEGLAPMDGREYSFGYVLWTGAAAAAGIALLHALVQYWQTVRLAIVGHAVTRSLRARVFDHLARLSPSFHAKHKAGDLLVRLVGDVSMLRTMLVDSSVELATRLLLIVGTLVVLVRMDAVLTLAVFSALPVLFLVTRWLSGTLTVAIRKQRRKEGELADYMHEAIAATEVIQSLGREDHVTHEFKRSNRRSARAGLKATRIAARISASVEGLLGLAVAGALALGAYRIHRDQLLGAESPLTPGALLVFLSYVRSLLKPVRSASRHAEKIAKGTACGERILAILEEDPSIQSKPGAPPAPLQPRELAFEDVSFSYSSDRHALDGMTVSFRRGELVALVGPSGAGKSTMAALAARIHDPARGRVTLDGQALCDLELTSVRERLGVCLQETVLFGESVRENLLLGKPDASEQELWAACEQAGAAEFVRGLPEGLDTDLGASGAGLSGGQRRRLALARTLLRRAPILVADEPFAGLDRRAAEQVAQELRRLSTDRIAVVIAHEFEHLDSFDQVVFIQGGRLVAKAPHEELLRNNASYRSVLRADAEVSA